MQLSKAANKQMQLTKFNSSKLVKEDNHREKKSKRYGKVMRTGRAGKRLRDANRQDEGIVVAKFAGVLNMNFNASAGVVNQPIFPHATGFCKRFSDMAYLYQMYRITKFRYWILPTETRVSDEEFGHAILPCDDGAPALGAFGDIVEIPGSKIYDARMVVPQENGVGFQKIVKQQWNWWSTTDSGNTKSDFVQANFFCMSSKGAISNTAIWEYEFIVEFKNPAYDGESVVFEPKGKPKPIPTIFGKNIVSVGIEPFDRKKYAITDSGAVRLRNGMTYTPGNRCDDKFCGQCGRAKEFGSCPCKSQPIK